MKVSLSARRAWIEMLGSACPGSMQSVALRKESVDRNTRSLTPISTTLIVALRKESVDRNDIETSRVCTDVESLSARRAWIEINQIEADRRNLAVALRKESVDRNLLGHCRDSVFERRSPQGERG